MEKAETPPFPEHLESQAGDHDIDAVAEAAWAQSQGNMSAFSLLCAEHLAGEINLLSDDPPPNPRSDPPGPGDDRYTATGGEVHGEAAMFRAGLPGAPVPQPPLNVPQAQARVDEGQEQLGDLRSGEAGTEAKT